MIKYLHFILAAASIGYSLGLLYAGDKEGAIFFIVLACWNWITYRTEEIKDLIK